MIPEQYRGWPVTMSIHKAAQLMNLNVQTLAKDKEFIESCTVKLGDKPKVVRDSMLRYLKVV